MSSFRDHSPARRRLSRRWAELRSSFGFMSGVAMVAAVVVGIALPALDDVLDVRLPLFAFESSDSARSLLQTVGTVTVSVAGLAFSVTLVAFTLTASQLSPRVLRSFRRDRISQAALACFLGTFIYCLVVLVRLGGGEAAAAPNLSMTLAILLAFIAFGLFATFIGHIVEMLQPSSVIAGIVEDARAALARPFPGEAGSEPQEPDAARDRVRERTAAPGRAVRSAGEGYLSVVRGEALIAAAREHDGLVRQRAALGDYVLPGDVLAELWCDGDGDGIHALAGRVHETFELDRQRSLTQDIAFPVRLLADIALKGLSPSIHDPTTAENAMQGLTAVLVRFAGRRRPAELRADADGVVRLVARHPDLDDLVRLGFEQVRVSAAPHPVVAARLLELLERVGSAAEAAGVPRGEIARQADLLAQGPDGRVPTDADAALVHDASARLHG